SLHLEGWPELLFTENETNFQRLFGVENASPHVKDAINDYVVHGRREAVNPALAGTKAAAHYQLALDPGETRMLRLRLAPAPEITPPFDESFDRIFRDRIREADEFYATVIPADLAPDARLVMRQALAGMLWSKQFYHYVVRDWLTGDPAAPPPPGERLQGRNR